MNYFTIRYCTFIRNLFTTILLLINSCELHIICKACRCTSSPKPLFPLEKPNLYFNVCFNEAVRNEKKVWNDDPAVSHARQAQERIQEFNRLKRARHLLDAISLTNELLTDGSDVEILSLAPTVIKRLKFLGVFGTCLENFNEATTASILKPHTGIYHCCTFCSSGGKKETTCGCGGTMPGGYKGCGHGHIGHPGVHHWSCCGSILHHGPCLTLQRSVHQLVL